MAIINKDVLTVRELVEMPLAIPDYQRPYKWQARHVNQLLEDVLHHRSKSSYRLGTVVLHQDDSVAPEDASVHFIVDGQQRLLTLTLLCHLLDKNRLCRPWLLEQSFSSPTTIRNLQHNAAVIESRAKQLSEADREQLLDFLLNKCQLICVTLDDLSEAFQFFDSQNARGKELQPYDLLKAFHLREMAENTEQERLQCVAAWEDDVAPEGETPGLNTIMSDVLFRIRRWTCGQPGTNFNRNNIDVFKGVNLRATPYRFTDSMRALDYMVDQYNADAIRHWDQRQMPYPFLVDQTMLNGKRFFEYIRHYIGIFKTLFIDKKSEIEPVLNTINRYEGCNRIGDHYVRNLFYCAVLYYYDKFGDVELEKAAILCFVWSYRIRLLQHRVVLESIDNAGRAQEGLIHAISRALHPHEVLAFTLEPVKESQKKGTKVDGLIAKFKELGYMRNDS